MKKYQLMFLVALTVISLFLLGCSREEKKAEAPLQPVATQQVAAAAAPEQVAPTNLKATDLHGKWHGEDEWISFDLYLHWDEGYYSGNHNITKKKPSVRTDGTTKSITITGQFTNVLPQSIAWSSMRGGKGTAEVTLIDKNTLKWKILTQQGEHYFPDEMILKRQ